MTHIEKAAPQVPLGYRWLDHVLLLLVASIVVIVACYTAWDIWQALTLTPGPLP